MWVVYLGSTVRGGGAPRGKAYQSNHTLPDFSTLWGQLVRNLQHLLKFYEVYLRTKNTTGKPLTH